RIGERRSFGRLAAVLQRPVGGNGKHGQRLLRQASAQSSRSLGPLLVGSENLAFEGIAERMIRLLLLQLARLGERFLRLSGIYLRSREDCPCLRRLGDDGNYAARRFDGAWIIFHLQSECGNA